MLAWYKARLASRPLLTQATTTALLFGLGDTIAQQAVDRVGPSQHDFKRTSRMALYGGVVFGPAAATWFKILQRRVSFPSSPNLTILARVACDQGLFAPTFIGIFLSSMAVLEGSDPREKLRQSYGEALKTNYMIWPFVQLVNFKLVPLEHRLLFVNTISIGWNCYLSYLNSHSDKKLE
ncbi:hypothetical protein QBC47DRAFT_212953 [Echria macrotheca]|uniref:Uncharacterized protein n=1 Tax=Echria macrotheca TaxID=438768 RepID=A0AAJ0BDH4_9PEZI|nr:hypothetical protein QBC47DRAFT_212953 [Echria macrotheca]